MASRSESRLLSGVKKGRPGSFDELYELYKLPIFNFLYQMTGNVEEAQDLTQDTFLTMYRVLTEGRKVESLKAYIYTVARNKALGVIERRKSERVDEEYVLQEPDRSYYADPERVMRNRKQQGDIFKALRMMPENYREVLVLREQAGFSYDRIAEILDTSRTNVGVLLFRARSKFRELYRMLQVTEKPASTECEKMLPLISAWLDGETSTKQERELRAHLSDCPFCRMASEQMVDASRTYSMLIPVIPPLAVKAGLMAKAGLAGAVPVSLAAGAGSAAGGIGAGVAAGAAQAGAGAALSSAAGAGAGLAAGGAATGISAKVMAVAAAAAMAVAAVGGGAYVGISRAVRRTQVTKAVLAEQIEEFLDGARDRVFIPEELRWRRDEVREAARAFLEKYLPELDIDAPLDVIVKEGDEYTVDLSGRIEKFERQYASQAVERPDSPVDLRLEVSGSDGEYAVEEMSREEPR